MQLNEYQTEAMKMLNPGLNQKEVLVNALMGLCGESGEAIDILKKHLFQGHDLDRAKIIKELGDVAWYLAEAATGLGVMLESICQGNLDKLHARYPKGFDTNRSQHRENGQ
ncbi:MAG: nucleoside triphosphate pyrophosphohydrolase family protein [Clostridia bacterium]|nr:nucleoside triphosphate pyrophosphohydrolase family protein [Clostridia bacterium]